LCQGGATWKEGAATARAELPFLFKAFETGQAPPPRPGTKKAEETRAATIHEYLDWTLTRQEGLVDDEKVTEKAVCPILPHPNCLSGLEHIIITFGQLKSLGQSITRRVNLRGQEDNAPSRNRDMALGKGMRGRQLEKQGRSLTRQKVPSRLTF
jgi:hypothetical protein